MSKAEIAAFDKRFRKKAKFLIDENIGKLAEILRDMGWNAVSATEVGLSGISDDGLFGRAWRDQTSGGGQVYFLSVSFPSRRIRLMEVKCIPI
jgi:hypothetical protein